MSSSHGKLFAPIKVGAWDLSHRIVLAPLTRMRASRVKGVPAPFAAEYYAQRASRIYSEEQVAAWRRITDAVHAKGARIVCQLWALGRIADPDLVLVVWGAGNRPFAPEGGNNGRADGDDNAKQVTPMSEEDIDRFVGHYRHAAVCAKAAGFDGVEIHGANGYLLDQFLQMDSNDRTDEYGGCLSNRFRFPLRALAAAVEVFGQEAVGIRMSPFSRFQGMREDRPLDVFVPWAETIAAQYPKLAYVHAVEGRAAGNLDVPEDLQKKEDTLQPIREVLERVGIVMIAAGGFTPDKAIEHAERYNDLIAFGRFFISNPDLPDRIASGHDLRPYDRATFYTQDTKGYTDYTPGSPAGRDIRAKA